MMDLDRFNLSLQDISVVAYQLSELSDAFHTTGNDRMASRMHSLSNVLLATREDLESFGNEAVNTFANTAREGSNNMLAMALTMAGILREEAENE